MLRARTLYKERRPRTRCAATCDAKPPWPRVVTFHSVGIHHPSRVLEIPSKSMRHTTCGQELASISEPQHGRRRTFVGGGHGQEEVRGATRSESLVKRHCGERLFTRCYQPPWRAPTPVGTFSLARSMQFTSDHDTFMDKSRQVYVYVSIHRYTSVAQTIMEWKVFGTLTQRPQWGRDLAVLLQSYRNRAQRCHRTEATKESTLWLITEKS